MDSPLIVNPMRFLFSLRASDTASNHSGFSLASSSRMINTFKKLPTWLKSWLLAGWKQNIYQLRGWSPNCVHWSIVPNHVKLVWQAIFWNIKLCFAFLAIYIYIMSWSHVLFVVVFFPSPKKKKKCDRTVNLWILFPRVQLLSQGKITGRKSHFVIFVGA